MEDLTGRKYSNPHAKLFKGHHEQYFCKTYAYVLIHMICDQDAKDVGSSARDREWNGGTSPACAAVVSPRMFIGSCLRRSIGYLAGHPAFGIFFSRVLFVAKASNPKSKILKLNGRQDMRRP